MIILYFQIKRLFAFRPSVPCGKMPPKGPWRTGAGKGHKVTKFVPSWLEKDIKGVPVKTWLTADPQNPQKGKCLICPPNTPFGRIFDISEGFTAITSHNKGLKHQERLATNQPEINHNDGPGQVFIEQAFQNQEKATKKHREQEEQVLEGQILFSNYMHFHGVPSKMFTCFAEIAPRLFPDSEVAKKWNTGKMGMRASKGDYFASYGIYPHLQEELVEILRTCYFSINFDESSVNKETNLDVNVSYWKGSRVLKSNYTIITMMEGTSAEEIVNGIISKLDGDLIPLGNIVDVSFIHF